MNYNADYVPNPNDHLSYSPALGPGSKTAAMMTLSRLIPDGDQESIQAFVEYLISSAVHITNRTYIAPLAAQVTVGGRAIAMLRSEFPELSDSELDNLILELVKNCIAGLRENEAAEQATPAKAAKTTKK